MSRKHRATRSTEVYTYTVLDEMFASPLHPTPADDRRHQLLRMWSGLASIESAPTPTNDDWRVCSDAVNLLETLVVQGIVEDRSGLLADAIKGLAIAGARSLEGQAIRLDGPGIQAVRAVLEDYAACLDVLPHRTMIRCHRATERRIRDIFRGKGMAGDVEVMAI